VASSIEYIGYGEAPWSEGSWGLDVLIISVDGVSATATLGEETVVAKATVSVTGLAGTTALGEETVVAKAVVEPTGVSATGNVGNVAIEGIANISVTGVEATVEEGTVIVALPTFCNCNRGRSYFCIRRYSSCN
jgi:hypothetical protein